MMKVSRFGSLSTTAREKDADWSTQPNSANESVAFADVFETLQSYHFSDTALNQLWATTTAYLSDFSDANPTLSLPVTAEISGSESLHSYSVPFSTTVLESEALPIPYSTTGLTTVTLSEVKDAVVYIGELKTQQSHVLSDNGVFFTSKATSSDGIYKLKSASDEVIILESHLGYTESLSQKPEIKLRNNNSSLVQSTEEYPVLSVYHKTPLEIQNEDFSTELPLTSDYSATNSPLSSIVVLKISEIQRLQTSKSSIHSSSNAFGRFSESQSNAELKQSNAFSLQGSYSSELLHESYSISKNENDVSTSDQILISTDGSLISSFLEDNENFRDVSSSSYDFKFASSGGFLFKDGLQGDSNTIAPEAISFHGVISSQQTHIDAGISLKFDQEPSVELTHQFSTDPYPLRVSSRPIHRSSLNFETENYNAKESNIDALLPLFDFSESDPIQTPQLLPSEVQTLESRYIYTYSPPSEKELFSDEKATYTKPYPFSSTPVPPLKSETKIEKSSPLNANVSNALDSFSAVSPTAAFQASKQFHDQVSTELEDALHNHTVSTFQKNSTTLDTLAHITLVKESDSAEVSEKSAQFEKFSYPLLSYSETFEVKSSEFSGDYFTFLSGDNTEEITLDPYSSSNYLTKDYYKTGFNVQKAIAPSDLILRSDISKVSLSENEQSTLLESFTTNQFFSNKKEESMQLTSSMNSGTTALQSLDIAKLVDSKTVTDVEPTIAIDETTLYTASLQASKISVSLATPTPTQKSISLETSETVGRSVGLVSDKLQASEFPQTSSTSWTLQLQTLTPSTGLLVSQAVPVSDKVFAPPPPQEDTATSIFEEFRTASISSLVPTKTLKATKNPHIMTSSNVRTSAVVSESSLLTVAGVNTKAPSTLSPPPVSRTNSTQGASSDHTSEIIIGSAAAVFLLALIVIGALLCLRWKRRKTKKPAATTDDLWMDSSNHHNMMPLPSLTTCAPDIEAPTRRENIYTVAFPYQPLQDGQLSLKKGDKLQLVEIADNGWWRGVSVKKGKSGWFPSSYVTATDNGSSEDLDNGFSEDIFTQNTEENKINLDLNRQISSFQIKRITSTETEKEANVFPVVEEQENMKDVQGWVNMAASISMMSLPTTEMSYSTNITDFTTAANGQRFRAVYAYKPVNRGEIGLKEGEMVTCQERDRNGWMLGRKTRTGEKGWFPAVYVDQVSSDDESVSDPEIPDTYDLLESNKLHKANQAFVGIDHEVAHPFSSPVPGDLALLPGETVTVLQTLANGWWFGVNEKNCGWFPASFVDMIEDTTPTDTQDQQGHLTSKEVAALLLSGLTKSDQPEQQTTLKVPEMNGKKGGTGSLSLPGSVAMRKHKSDDRLDVISVSSQNTATDLRPHRKAPPPPSPLRNSVAMSETASEVGTQQEGTLRRPARRAPAPPVSHNAKSKAKGSKEKVGVSNCQAKPPDATVLLINGKRPKLQKITPDRLDKKSLNPMIRPSTRGFMPRPIDNSRDIWESRPEKRLLEGNHHRGNHGNRASSNLGSHASSPVAAGPDPGASFLATGQPSPTSHSSSLMPERLQNLTGHTTSTGTGLSRSSSLGSSINSHATLSTPAAAVNSSSLSDDSRATLTNLPENRLGGSYHQDENDDGDDESNNGRDTPGSTRLAKFGGNRSRSQSPAIFPPASPSALLHNIQRFNQRHFHSQYSSDASDAGSISARPTSVKSVNVPRQLGEPPSHPSSTTHRSHRPKSQGAFSKRRDRRHRTLTSVLPPSVPRLTSTNRSFSGAMDSTMPNDHNFPKIKIHVNKASSNRHNNSEVEDDDALKNSQSTFHAPPKTPTEEPCNNNHNTSFLKSEPPSSVSYGGDATSAQKDIPAVATYQPDPGVEIRNSSPDTTNPPSPVLRNQSPNSPLDVEDTALARDSLRNLVPGTVSGIVQQINKLNPNKKSSDKSNGASSCNSSQGKGSIVSSGDEIIASALNENNNNGNENSDTSSGENHDIVQDKDILNGSKENKEVANIVESDSTVSETQTKGSGFPVTDYSFSSELPQEISSITLDPQIDNCSTADPGVSDV